MSYTEIRYELEGAVARLTLDRPERRNPIGPSTVGELLHALALAKADPAVRVVVVTGAGKVFSAGGDLSAMLAQPAGQTPLAAEAGRYSLPGTYVDLNLALAELGKPSIAMVNGHALAGGLGLVLACDLAIAAEEAELGAPEINVGLWPMMIMSTIFRHVPRKRGLELILTGERIGAKEAVALGLVNRAVPREALEGEVAALAAKLAAKSPEVMQLGLDAFYRAQDLELPAALAYLQERLTAVLATEDAREGLTAFLEKRPPVWRGR